MRIALVVLGLGLASTATAAPVCRLRGQPWLEGRVQGESIASRRAIDARLGQTLEVFVVAPGRLDGRSVLFSDAPGKGRVSWTKSGCGALSVSWRRVEPRMEHVSTRAPNAEAKIYANAVVFGPKHGEWIGYDRLEYFESPVGSESSAESGGATLHVRDATPSDETGLHRDGANAPLGTMRLAATIQAGDQTLATPGAADAPSGLISDRVFRYSFRSGDGFLGWLTAYYNVPYLFGSAGQGKRNQAERYLGADCADVLVAALRHAGRRDLDYSSVASLVDDLERVSSVAVIAPCPAGLANCKPTPAAPPLRWGRDLRPGDLLALDYVDEGSLPRAWDHIVALVEDRGPDGKPDGLLGPEDLVADSGDASGLKLAPLAEQGKIRVQVLRARGVPVL